MSDHAPNALMNESSPYLLQHAHNPVQWLPWGAEALRLAQESDRPLLISIGYSACHWCHVMERESFEDQEVAEAMNHRFVCVKVDREERPDVDQLYMEAVQMMTGQGGWPLNCFALPDGRPFHGGTYFPRDRWLALLDQLAEIWKRAPDEVRSYADKLTSGVKSNALIAPRVADEVLKGSTLDEMAADWATRFDRVNGGLNRAPKFPMPASLLCLLRLGRQKRDNTLTDHVHLTLRCMALGGIYDQIGGGFARYSVDGIWKVPHFEKMLYDNAQLLSVYAEAHLHRPDALYGRVLRQTIAFVQRELTSADGFCYSALDADSEGEEGLFYLWDENQFNAVLADDADWAARWFKVGGQGLWEHGRSILLGRTEHAEFAHSMNITLNEFQVRQESVISRLMVERDKRPRPGTDDKQLTSWNALMLKGLCDAAMALNDQSIVPQAKRIAGFLTEQQTRPDGSLWHTYKNGRSTVDGFLDDHALTIEAMIALYNLTFEARWLHRAQQMTEMVLNRFDMDGTSMLRFTQKNEKEELAAPTVETQDNVIPASNSVMARNLLTLGLHFGDQAWVTRSRQMVADMAPALPKAGPWYANWADLLRLHTGPLHEVAVTGPDHFAMARQLQRGANGPLILAAGDEPNGLMLLDGRTGKGQTLIHVCQNGACALPTAEVAVALQMLGGA